MMVEVSETRDPERDATEGRKIRKRPPGVPLDGSAVGPARRGGGGGEETRVVDVSGVSG